MICRISIGWSFCLRLCWSKASHAADRFRRSTVEIKKDTIKPAERQWLYYQYPKGFAWLTCLVSRHFMFCGSQVRDWFQDSYRYTVYSAVVSDNSVYKTWGFFSHKVLITLLDCMEILHKLLCKQKFHVSCSIFLQIGIWQLCSLDVFYTQYSSSAFMGCTTPYRSEEIFSEPNSTRNMQIHHNGVNFSATFLWQEHGEKRFQTCSKIYQ